MGQIRLTIACRIKHTTDPSLPPINSMMLIELLFGRSPRTPLDTVEPQVDDTKVTGELDNFVERRTKIFAKSGLQWKRGTR